MSVLRQHARAGLDPSSVNFSYCNSDLHISAYDLPNLGVLVRFISFKSAQLTGINRAFQAKESFILSSIFTTVKD